MFERFTEKAIRVLQLAQNEARNAGHNFVETEHILLGLIAEGNGRAAQVLKSMGISLKDARLEIENFLDRDNRGSAEEITFTPRTQQILEFSLEEAIQLKHNYIDTEHLLLGLIRERDSRAANILEKLGIDLHKMRSNVFKIFAAKIEVKFAYLPLNNFDEKLDFLKQVLLVILKTKGDPQVVDGLLQANLDKLDDNLAIVLQSWATDYLPEEDSEQARGIALAINIFSDLLNQFPLGSRTSNLKIAITGYQVITIVFTREAFPRHWAAIQNNLGNAYNQGILGEAEGEAAENVETAIRCYSNALEIFTRETFPFDWAITQVCLGEAYRNRIQGEKAENLETAIRCYEAALQEYTCEAFPQEWAAAQTNLGTAYVRRIRGDRIENLEAAIKCYEAALKVRTRKAFPQEWANTQIGLGNAYSDLIRGDRAENLEAAIRYYLNALKVFSYEAFPQQWAEIQNNIGNAYCDRIRGERAKNLEIAIDYFSAALEVFNREAFPVHWATTQNNLGTTYNDLSRRRGEYGAGKIREQAIRCYQNALQIFTRQAFPQNYAATQLKLGLAYQETRQLRQAYIAFAPAIDTIEFLRVEIVSGDEARQKLAEEWNELYRRIVEVSVELGDYTRALEYAERSRAWRLVDLMASNDLYGGGEIPPQVREYLQQYDTLQEQIDRERERLRRQTDSTKEFADTGTSSRSRAALAAATEEIERLEAQKHQIREQIRRLDPVLAGQIKVEALDLATTHELIDQPNTVILSFFTTSTDTHIFIIFKNQSLQLHICKGFGYQALRNLVFDRWLIPYLESKQNWRVQMENVLQQLAEKLQLTTLVKNYLSGIEEVIIIPHLFWHQIPFAALPLTNPIQVNSQLPDNKPSGMMRQLVETFTRLEKKNNTQTNISVSSPAVLSQTQYLGDKFRLRYVPSCQILQYCQQRPALDRLNYGTVEDADGTLPGSGFEGEKIAQIYQIPETQRLRGRSQATVSNYRQLLKNVQVLHSSHHASSRLDNPLESTLILADGRITLGQIMTPGWRLPNLSDVFLSCCETNLGVANITDDILTLATGFLCAGARSVVSTLWAVDDLATAIFSILYYQHRQQGLNRPKALWQAQFKLRTLTGQTLAAQYRAELETHLQQQSQQAAEKRDKAVKNRKRLFEGTPEYQRWDEEHKEWDAIASRIFKVKESLKTLCRQDFPFADPYYWAGFICSGLR